jgi:type I restriction enzyme S subunit
MAIQIQKYPSYKPTGVAWLGNVPSHWEVIRMKHLFKDVSIKNKADAELLSVTQSQGVVPRTWVENRMVMPSGNLESFKFIEKGDFAISLRSFEGGLEYCYHDGIISPAYTVLKAKRAFYSDFYKYLFKSYSFIAELQTSIVGIREGKNISYEELCYSFLPIPPIKEQTAIAQYLDRKTAQIDTAIAQKQTMIDLLKERRQILIHQAVTQGLDPSPSNRDASTVKRKYSGVEWIGEVPEHWEVKKIKHITTKIGSGVTPTGGGTAYLESGIPLLRSQNVLFGKIELEGVAFISQKTHDSMNNSQVKKGDVLLNITGGSIGRCHYVDVDISLNVNQHVCIVRPSNQITTIYLNGLLASEVGQGQIWFFQQGGGREGLNFQAIKNFYVPLPPKEEQEQIATYIATQTTKLETAISLKTQEIERLKEYKSTLINSVVTGQVRVCEL